MKFIVIISSLIFLGSAKCGHEPDKKKECTELSSKGQTECEKHECEWKNNTCEKKTSAKFTACTEITDSTVCIEPNVVAGKKCQMVANKCVELSQIQIDFESKDQVFKNEAKDTVDAFGLGHGMGNIDWEALCTKANTNADSAQAAQRHIKEMGLKFVKGKKDVEFSFLCGANSKTYNLTYAAKALPENTFLIKLDLNAQNVPSPSTKAGGDIRSGNQLEAFTKGYWLFDPSDKTLTGVTFLPNSETKKVFDATKSIKDAADYIKKDGWNLGKDDKGVDIEGMLFIFKQ